MDRLAVVEVRQRTPSMHGTRCQPYLSLALQFYPLRDDCKGLHVVYEPRLVDVIFRLHYLRVRQQPFLGQGHAHVVLPVEVITNPQENFGALGGHVSYLSLIVVINMLSRGYLVANCKVNFIRVS